MAKFFSTTRRLRPYKSKNGHQVFVRVKTKDKTEFDIPAYDYVNHSKVPISVHREHWLKGFVTGGNYHLPTREMNFLLSKVERNVKDAVNELIDKKVPLTRDNIQKLTYINEENELSEQKKINSGELIVDEQGGAFASFDEFREFVASNDDNKFDNLKKEMGIYKKKYILDFWFDFIRSYAPDSYDSTRKPIEEYIKHTNDNCLAKSFSKEWLERLFEHLIKNGYSFKKDESNRKPFTIETLKKHRKHLISFGDYLFEEAKVLENVDFKRFNLKNKSKKKSLIKFNTEPYSNTHALSKEEFDHFYFFQFKEKNLSLARDMFILQTWFGGLRISDFCKLTTNSFSKDANGNYLVIFNQNKTIDEVQNIVNQDYITPIISKYENIFDVFLPANKYNDLLKEAAKEAGLTRELRFRYDYAKDKTPTIEFHPIYKKMCNEWARNCAVSILSELGHPDDRISKFIGHRDLKMIKHYKQIHSKDIHNMVLSVKPETNSNKNHLNSSH